LPQSGHSTLAKGAIADTSIGVPHEWQQAMDSGWADMRAD